MKGSLLAVLMMVLPRLAAAQDSPVKPELRPFVGASIPLGDQRNVFDPGGFAGLQVAFEFRPTVHLVGSFAWIQANGLTAAKTSNQVQYDVGIELNMARSPMSKGALAPFLGLGFGQRRFSYPAAAASLSPTFRVGEGDPAFDAAYASHVHESSAVTYLTLGTEVYLGRTALRLEARGNTYMFRSPDPALDHDQVFDIGVSLGLAYHFH